MESEISNLRLPDASSPLGGWSSAFPPAIGVSGPSGSGKTLLLDRLVPRLIKRGLKVAVVKHCSHHIDADRPGKDSDRLFRAGAEVLAAGPTEAFARFHVSNMPLAEAVPLVAAGCDVCLVEGYRGEDLPRIEIAAEDQAARSTKAAALLTVTDPPAQVVDAEALVWRVLEESHRARPVLAVVLTGGQSTRMGQAKALLDLDGAPVLDRIISAVAPHAAGVVLAGSGPVPKALANLDRLPDVPGQEGPLAGILSAVRWQPAARWLVLACDLPLIEPDAVRWLLGETQVGFDAVFPQSAGGADEPLFAVYEPTSRPFLERAAQAGVRSPRRALAAARVLRPVVPAALRHAWTNVNTPEEWEAVLQRQRDRRRVL